MKTQSSVAKRLIAQFGYAEIQSGVYQENTAEIQSGVYLYSRENIIVDQKMWMAEDEFKNFDFSTSSFWITDDSFTSYKGFDSIEEALNSVKGKAKWPTR